MRGERQRLNLSLPSILPIWDLALVVLDHASTRLSWDPLRTMRDSEATMLSLKTALFFTLICGKHIGDMQALSCQCCLLAV